MPGRGNDNNKKWMEIINRGNKTINRVDINKAEMGEIEQQQPVVAISGRNNNKMVIVTVTKNTSEQKW